MKYLFGRGGHRGFFWGQNKAGWFFPGFFCLFARVLFFAALAASFCFWFSLSSRFLGRNNYAHGHTSTGVRGLGACACIHVDVSDCGYASVLGISLGPGACGRDPQLLNMGLTCVDSGGYADLFPERKLMCTVKDIQGFSMYIRPTSRAGEMFY